MKEVFEKEEAFKNYKVLEKEEAFKNDEVLEKEEAFKNDEVLEKEELFKNCESCLVKYFCQTKTRLVAEAGEGRGCPKMLK